MPNPKAFRITGGCTLKRRRKVTMPTYDMSEPQGYEENALEGLPIYGLGSGPHTFWGVDGRKFKINDTIYQAVACENGYGLGELRKIIVVKEGNFSKRPGAPVYVYPINISVPKRLAPDVMFYAHLENGIRLPFEGYILADPSSDEIFLWVGTEKYGTYEPGFVFKYHIPKEYHYLN